MRTDVLIIGILAIVSMMLFAYFRNKQAQRNDERRERLSDKYDELMELLKKKNEEDGKGN